MEKRQGVSGYSLLSEEQKRNRRDAASRYYYRKRRRLKTLPAPERFWLHVDKTEGCWLWVGGKTPSGYGIFSVAGRSIRAHRFSWAQHNGLIPEGLFVCHTCDTPACVNPHHLFVGTAQDNMDDKVRKGRTTTARRQN